MKPVLSTKRPTLSDKKSKRDAKKAGVPVLIGDQSSSMTEAFRAAQIKKSRPVKTST